MLQAHSVLLWTAALFFLHTCECAQCLHVHWLTQVTQLGSMCSKLEMLQTFFTSLDNPCFTIAQKKALLLSLNRQQRLGIIELILNIVYENIDISDDTLDELDTYRKTLRGIASRGQSVTNRTLARHCKGVLLALKIANTRVKLPLVKESKNKQVCTTSSPQTPALVDSAPQ